MSAAGGSIGRTEVMMRAILNWSIFRVFIHLPFRRQRKSFAKALHLNGDRIPDDRKEFLQQELLKHYPPGTDITDELLLEAIGTETG